MFGDFVKMFSAKNRLVKKKRIITVCTIKQGLSNRFYTDPIKSTDLELTRQILLS